MRSYLIAAIPIILSIGLLVGLRMNQPIAPPLKLVEQYKDGKGLVVVEPELSRRGETMQTISGVWRHYQYAKLGVVTDVYLYENTQVKLVATGDDGPYLQIIEGRMVVKGPSTVTVRDVKIPTTETSAFTFYPWLDKLDVAEISESPRSFSIDTLNSVTTQQLDNFDPENSSAAPFYTWALGSAIK